MTKDPKNKLNQSLMKLAKKIEELAKRRREATNKGLKEPAPPEKEQLPEIDLYEDLILVKEYEKRALEWFNGTFFWKCFLLNGITYEPIFNKGLFDGPRVAGEPISEMYKKK